MRTSIAFLVLSLCLTSRLSAQLSQFGPAPIGEVRFGYCISSYQQLYALEKDDPDKYFPGASASGRIIRQIGPIEAEYGEFRGERMRYSVHYNYGYFEEEFTSGPVLVERVHETYHTLMIGAEYHFLRSKKFDMYSGVSGGMAIRTKQHLTANYAVTNFIGAFHLAGLGVRYGGPVGIGVEGGFGYKGIVNAYISFIL
jgi:hypothetical protein